MSCDGFGIYRLLEPIGDGASGVVYAAEYGTLRRPVAIKVLHRGLVGDGSARRLLEEARTISMLDHPGIVKVFDVGVSSDGRAYVVMEHLIGESLSARLAHARLTEQQVVRFARQLTSALEAAHAAGVIHRDLKPENVLIVADPDMQGAERIKLIDFGIAKRDGQERTATGLVLGTPGFMAPEQFAASNAVDTRADIYSLGVVLYLMVTGTAPFAGQDTDELQAEHAFCMPPPVAAVAGVSNRLSAIIERCLAKRPDDRFATVNELGTALRELEVAHEARSRFDDARTSVWKELDRVATKRPRRFVRKGTPHRWLAIALDLALIFSVALLCVLSVIPSADGSSSCRTGCSEPARLESLRSQEEARTQVSPPARSKRARDSTREARDR